MIFETFDVVVVPFPFTDIQARKRRPALVLSNPVFNDAHTVVALAMITSARQSRWPSDTPIRGGPDAGLRAESVVRLKLFTLDRGLVLRKIGALNQEDRAAITRTIRAHLV